MTDDISDADALAALRRIAAQIEAIGVYCPRCGVELFDGVTHRCSLVSAVEDESGVTAMPSKATLQAPDSPFALQSPGDRLPA